MTAPIHFAIGGITFRVTPVDDANYHINSPLSEFLTPPARAEVQLTVRTAPRDERKPGTLLFDSGALWRLVKEESGFRIECTAEPFGPVPYKFVSVDPTMTRGEIVIRRDTFDHDVDPFEYPLDEVLVSNLLPKGRGIELHSCGLRDADGNGHLFVGVSGAGKSTTAHLWESEALILSDDRVIVREEQGEFRIYGTPWHGEGQFCSPESAPLCGIYLLQQAPRTEIRELDRAETVARLFTCAFPLFHDQAALGFTIGFLEHLVRSLPVRELRFTPDRSAVEIVRNAVRTA